MGEYMGIDELTKMLADADTRLQELQIEAYKVAGEHRLLERLIGEQQPAAPAEPVHVPVDGPGQPADAEGQATNG